MREEKHGKTAPLAGVKYVDKWRAGGMADTGATQGSTKTTWIDEKAGSRRVGGHGRNTGRDTLGTRLVVVR